MTTASTARLAFEGRSLAFDVAGAGPLVVCLPGMGDLRSAYRHLVPELVARGMRVATLDLPGHGDSDATAEPLVGQRDIARAAVALARHLGGPAIVVGHSYTPDSALLATQLAPDAIVGAVAIAPWASTAPPSPAMRVATRAVTSSALLWSLFYRSLHRTPPVDLGDHRRHIVASMRRPHGTAALRAMGEGSGKDAIDARATQTAPVAVVMGERDPDFRDPAAEAKAYAEAMPAGVAEVRTVAGAGHYPHAERPVETADAVLALARRVGWAVGSARA